MRLVGPHQQNSSKPICRKWIFSGVQNYVVWPWVRTYEMKKKPIESHYYLHGTNDLKKKTAMLKAIVSKIQREIHHRDVHWKVIFISVENFISCQLEMLEKWSYARDYDSTSWNLHKMKMRNRQREKKAALCWACEVKGKKCIRCDDIKMFTLFY